MIYDYVNFNNTIFKLTIEFSFIFIKLFNINLSFKYIGRFLRFRILLRLNYSKILN